MNFTKYENKGLSGLANLGNTCFVNSCLQILSHTYELNHFLDAAEGRKMNPICDSALLIEWNSLRHMLWSTNCIIAPNKFIRTVQTVAGLKHMQLFTGNSQNDISEFLLFVLDCFHNALKREIKMTISGTAQNETDIVATKCFEMMKQMYSKDYSEIWDLFYAVHVSELTRTDTGDTVALTPEPYFMIDLPIPPNNKCPSLKDCFDLYVAGEVLDGENGWYDKSVDRKICVTKKIQFWSFPNVLVIDFKRFNARNQKNQILITFPMMEELDLSEYVIGYRPESYKYELYGVCNHSGGVLGGHYTAYIKNANGKWFHCNDTMVSEVGLLESIVSPKAYCLFYRKKR